MKLLESKSFRTRTRVSIVIVLVVVAGFTTTNAIGVRLLFWLATAAAMAEIFSTYLLAINPAYPVQANNYVTSRFGVVLFVANCFVAGSVVSFLPTKILALCILSSYGSDALAYLFGKIFGGKLFKSNPFPTTSPNKTWEGVLAGVFGIMPFIYLVNTYYPSNTVIEQDVCSVFMLGGAIGSIGDFAESWLKRQLNLHDSNDIVAEAPVFRLFEGWLGGRDGHGGYADRIDSLLLVTTICGSVYLITTGNL